MQAKKWETNCYVADYIRFGIFNLVLSTRNLELDYVFLETFHLVFRFLLLVHIHLRQVVREQERAFLIRISVNRDEASRVLITPGASKDTRHANSTCPTQSKSTRTFYRQRVKALGLVTREIPADSL